MAAFIDQRYGQGNALSRRGDRGGVDSTVCIAANLQHADVADHTGEFAVTDNCYILGQGEGHVLGDVSAVGCVFSPYGGIDREVHGVDALLGKFGNPEFVPYFCGAVVGHVIEMSGVAGVDNVKGPGSGCRTLAGAASGACSGAGTGGSAAAGNIRLDGDIPECIILAWKILSVYGNGKYHFHHVSRNTFRGLGAYVHQYQCVGIAGGDGHAGVGLLIDGVVAGGAAAVVVTGCILIRTGACLGCFCCRSRLYRLRGDGLCLSGCFRCRSCLLDLCGRGAFLCRGSLPSRLCFLGLCHRSRFRCVCRERDRSGQDHGCKCQRQSFFPDAILHITFPPDITDSSVRMIPSCI